MRTRWHWVLKLMLIWAGLLGFLESAKAAAPPLAGRLIDYRGDVTVQRAAAGAWEKAQIGASLFAGDVIKTGSASLAAILVADESQLKLHEHTVLELRSVSPSPRLRLADHYSGCRGKGSPQPLRRAPGRGLA